MHTATYVGLFTLIVCLGGIAALIWAIRNRQFEEERRAVMSVFDDEPDFSAAVPRRFSPAMRRWQAAAIIGVFVSITASAVLVVLIATRTPAASASPQTAAKCPM